MHAVSRIARVFLRALFRVRVDRRPDDASGPVLFAANHPAAIDSLLLALFLPPGSVVVLPREDLRSRWLRLALSFLPHLVADVNDPATLKKVMRLLAAGRSVALFPEGRVFHAPSVMKVYEVPALIAAKTGVAVVSVRLSYRRGWRLDAHIRMRSPVPISAPGETGPRARRARATEQLQRLMETAAYEER